MAGYLLCENCKAERKLGEPCYVCGAQFPDCVKVSDPPDLVTVFFPNRDRIIWDRKATPKGMSHFDHRNSFYLELFNTGFRVFDAGAEAWAISMSNPYSEITFNYEKELPKKTMRAIK